MIGTGAGGNGNCAAGDVAPAASAFGSTAFVSAAGDGRIGKVAAAPVNSADFLMKLRRENWFFMDQLFCLLELDRCFDNYYDFMIAEFFTETLPA